jgi:hypothetical protein
MGGQDSSLEPSLLQLLGSLFQKTKIEIFLCETRKRGVKYAAPFHMAVFVAPIPFLDEGIMDGQPKLDVGAEFISLPVAAKPDRIEIRELVPTRAFRRLTAGSERNFAPGAAIRHESDRCPRQSVWIGDSHGT